MGIRLSSIFLVVPHVVITTSIPIIWIIIFYLDRKVI